MKKLSLSERLNQFATDQDDLSRRGEKNLAAEAAQAIDSLTAERDQLVAQVEILKSFI
jgi:cell division protein FtsB